MKREADGEMGTPQKRTRRGDEEVRLLIPSKVAGSIIGKRGQNITKLRQQYKASITVPDCPGPERMLTLSSDMDSVCNIINDVMPNLEENGARVNNGNELDLRMMIHQSQAGCVIGKGGSKIREIREKIGARIKIFSNLAPQSTDRVIQIIGEPAKCIETIREVLTIIKQSPIKGAVNPYDPHNYDEFYSEDYGGWGNQGAGGQIGMGSGNRRNQSGNGAGGSGGPGRGMGNSGPPPPPPQRMRDNRFGNNNRDNNRSGGSNPRFNAPRSSMNSAPNRPPPFGNNSPFGTGNNFGNNQRSMNGSAMNSAPPPPPFERNGWSNSSQSFNKPAPPPPIMSNPPIGNLSQSTNSGGKTTTQVTIPKDLAGAIIGKGGGRIRKIRLDSGANITIDEPLPGSNERIITIAGLPNQIQMAQYLLQQSVHNNAERHNY